MARDMNLLRVPIRIDGLYVESGGLEVGLPMADFSRLPYNLSNGSTINKSPPTPNLAEAAFNPRLGDNQNTFSLPKGLHLHWALPDALTTGHDHPGSTTQFPAVPNRWLVRRLDNRGTLQKSWVVESDFLHPLDSNHKPIHQSPLGITAWPNDAPITFPTKRLQLSNGKQGAAFRYMGQSLLLSDWLNRQADGDYLNQHTNSDYKLTALGYGEPAFAAYYPNCYSVFGFCDIDPDLHAGTSYEYQVIGWFHESGLDPLQSAEFAGLSNDAARYAALRREYLWCLSEDDTKKAFPVRTVCYASLTLKPNQVTPWQSQGAVDIAIGNTGGEALSALLADEVAQPQGPADKVMIEDQLEAMNLAATLQGVEVDYLAHFVQTRHQRGFRGFAGGNRWSVLPKAKSPRPASAADANLYALPQPPLPDSVAHALDALNTSQENYNMAQQEIVELRYQTFCDWHKFLSALYSDSVSLQPYRDQSDDLSNFIKSQGLQPLNDKISLAGTLVVEKDKVKAATLVEEKNKANAGDTVTLDLSTNALTPAKPANVTLAVEVILRLKALVDMLAKAKLTDHFELALRQAENFWSPREPVVLLSGPVAVSTPRHGEDGDLACAVLNLPDARPGTAAFIAAVVKPAESGDPSIQAQTASPWHPIILEWSVSVQPVIEGRTANHDIINTLDYEPNFVTGSFKLQGNEPDFVPDKLKLFLGKNYYEGRCVTTPTASTQLDTNLRNFLIKATLYDCRDRAASLEANYLERLIAWYLMKHSVAPPAKDAKVSEKISWAKQQKPFVDEQHKDPNGNPVLLKIAELLTWYDDKPVKGANNTVGNPPIAKQQAQDPVYSAMRALSHLDGKKVLSQALGGFNAALMSRKRVLQIPIDDPQADESINLTTAVAAAVGPHHPMAPLPSKVFSPIRSGSLTLKNLRLIDTFGQQWNTSLPGAHVVSSNGLTNPDKADKLTYLPPRFTPPARLNFRWLAALSGQEGVDEVEMNSAPATTPICGWLLPNNFDNSVMVYDHSGLALGSINTLAEWMPAPGSDNRMAAAEIPNPHLRRLVRRLVIDVGTPEEETRKRQDFMQGFLSTLDSAIEAIEPASFAQHEALALLMGRPIAVVRARVDLQLMGQPLVSEIVEDPTIAGGKAFWLRKSPHWGAFADQDWEVFAYDWGHYYQCKYDEVKNESCLFLSPPPANYARTTHGFENVVIPIRLGEHQLLNDGLVGFWKETADGQLDNVFHAPQTLDDVNILPDVTYREGITTPCIRAYTTGATDNLRLTLQDDPLALTILMDPRGVVHATSGVFPVYKLEIPSTYYADTLKRMGVTFRVSPLLTDGERLHPLLTDGEQLHAALPKEAGYVWSWVAKRDGSTWEETAAIVDATEHAHFFKPPKIVEGWLKLTPKDKG
jgi:hypothetical protein